jgi:hypothetical protein
MSLKGASEEGRKELRAPGSKAKHLSLPEITDTGWRDWDENMGTLQEHIPRYLPRSPHDLSRPTEINHCTSIQNLHGAPTYSY